MIDDTNARQNRNRKGEIRRYKETNVCKASHGPLVKTYYPISCYVLNLSTGWGLHPHLGLISKTYPCLRLTSDLPHLSLNLLTCFRKAQQKPSPRTFT